MLSIEPRKLTLVYVNPSPMRVATRAALKVAVVSAKPPKQRLQWPVYPEPITMRTLRQWGELA